MIGFGKAQFGSMVVNLKEILFKIYFNTIFFLHRTPERVLGVLIGTTTMAIVIIILGVTQTTTSRNRCSRLDQNNPSSALV